MKNYKLLALFPSYHSEKHSNPIGGGEISNRILLEDLVAKGWQVEVVTSETDIEGIYRGVRVHKARRRRTKLASTLFRHRDLKKLSIMVGRSVRPDVIISATSALEFAHEVSDICGARNGLIVRAFENFESLVGAKSKKNLFKRKVFESISGSYQVGERAADFYIFNSVFMEERISPSTTGRSYVVYPPFDCEVKRKCVESINNIAMVGLTDDKGYGVLRAVALCFPNIVFSVYGKRSASILEGDLPSNVTYKGWADKSDIYSGADIFMVPSKWEEPFGRVAVEALAFGCIVLVSNKGGLPETVDFCQDLIIDAEAPRAWCEVIGKVVSDPKSFVLLSECLAKGISKYSIDAQVTEFERVLIENFT